MYKHILLGSVLIFTSACDSGSEQKSIADKIGPATKNINELKQETKLTPEEAEARRKAAGFKSKAEIDAELAAQNAAAMEKDERSYVKTRLKDYRALADALTKFVDDLEKETAKWATAKDPQKAFDKGAKPLQERFKELTKTIDKLSEKGIKGGNTQDLCNKVFRPLEELAGALAPTIHSDPALAETFKTIRSARDNLVKALDEIDKDATLTINTFHKDDAAADKKPAAK